MIKKRLAVIILLAAIILSAGCSAKPSIKADATATPTQIPNNKWQFVNRNIPFYWPDATRTRLVSINMLIQIDQRKSVIEQVMNKLIQGSDLENCSSLFVFNDANSYTETATEQPDKESAKAEAKTVKLLSIQQLRNVAIVNLSGEFIDMTEKDRFIARMCIANTLIGIQGIQYVSLLVNGDELALDGIPVGLMVEYGDMIDQEYSNYQVAHQSTLDAGIDRRDVMLFFGANNSKHIIPEVRSIAVKQLGYADAVIQEIFRGPRQAELKNIVPTGLAISAKTITILNDNGTKSIRVTLSADSSFDVTVMETSLMPPALVYSLTSLIPGIEGVDLCIMDSAGAELYVHRFTPESFPQAVGYIVPVYLPSADGQSLVKVLKTLAADEANKSDAVKIGQVVYSQITAEALGDKGTNYIDLNRLSNLTQVDIDILKTFLAQHSCQNEITVTVSDSTAYVDISARLHGVLKLFTGRKETLFIYSIVNTMTEDSTIRGVQFLVEGRKTEKLIDKISTNNVLIRNPGIIE